MKTRRAVSGSDEGIHKVESRAEKRNNHSNAPREIHGAKL